MATSDKPYNGKDIENFREHGYSSKSEMRRIEHQKKPDRTGTRKQIQLSSLAMRFYEHDGWTREELEACLSRGELKHWKDDYRPYFVLTAGSRFDVEKLKALVSEVVPRFGNQSTDIEEMIREYNW